MFKDLTVIDLNKKYKSGELKVVDVVSSILEKIEDKDKEYNCYITVIEKEKLIKKAEDIQSKIDNGVLIGPLAGIPIAIKDNICTEGILTTCGSKILYNYIPQFSSEAVLNLEKEGAIIIGKTNMDEFAMGSTTETSYYGPTINPFGEKRVPGGSSGGSAAAIIAEECIVALGSDTGGSIRQPASYCGVVGMKPTYGTVSRYGLVAYGSSLDQIGPLTRSVTDCAITLDAIASYDVKDSTSIKREKYDFAKALVENVEGIKIGIPRAYFSEGLNDSVRDAVLSAAKLLEKKGATIEVFDLGLVKYAIPAYYVIASAEASSNLARYDGVKYGYRINKFSGLHEMYKKTRSEGFGLEVKRRIMLGSFVLSSGYYDAYYLKALRTKALIKKEFDRAFEKYDLILGPAAPTTAPKIGESLSDPLKMYLGDVYTISANLSGIPGICLPCGVDNNGMPIGVQLLGDCFNENLIIRAAYTYEQSRGDFRKMSYDGTGLDDLQDLYEKIKKDSEGNDSVSTKNKDEEEPIEDMDDLDLNKLLARFDKNLDRAEKLVSKLENMTKSMQEK